MEIQNLKIKTAYHWNQDRVFVAVSEAIESPQEPGVFYPPSEATFDPVPDIPAGKRAVRNEQNTAWLLEDIPPPVDPIEELTDEQKQILLDRAIQRRLNEGARAWGYDSMDRAATYVSSTRPKWAAEAAALIAWRDDTWDTAHAIRQAVLAGDRPIPTEAELLSELPPQPPRPVA